MAQNSVSLVAPQEGDDLLTFAAQQRGEIFPDESMSADNEHFHFVNVGRLRGFIAVESEDSQSPHNPCPNLRTAAPGHR